MEQAQEIENEEIIAPPEEVAEKPVSLRETIEKARDEVKEEPVKEAKKVKVKSHERTVTKEKTLDDGTPKVEVKEELIPAPQAYSGPVKAKWAELPKDIQQELSKREADFHKELTKHDEERNFGRQIERVVTPYMAQIRAEGATAPQAIESLLNMAHLLRVGTPQQKSDLLLRTAQQWGVDLRQALQVQQTQPQLPPQFQNALGEIQGLKAKLEQQEALKKQQEDAEIQSQIKTFSADPKNVHFEAVKAHMASLLSSGLAKDLQDAYDQAVYANPHTRSSLLEAAKATQDEQRVANTKAKAEAAKKAGSSLKGAPGMAATKNGKINGLDLRSTIKAAFAENMDS